MGAVDAQAWHDRVFWHVVSSQGNLLFVDRQRETVTVPVPELGIDISTDVRERIVSQFDPEERREFDRLMADEVRLCSNLCVRCWLWCRLLLGLTISGPRILWRFRRIRLESGFLKHTFGSALFAKLSMR